MSISAFCRRAGVSRTQLYEWFSQPKVRMRLDLMWAVIETLGLTNAVESLGYVRDRTWRVDDPMGALVTQSIVDGVFSGLMRSRGARGKIQVPTPQEAVPLRLDDSPDPDDNIERELALRIPVFSMQIPAGGWSDCPDGHTIGDRDGFIQMPESTSRTAFAARIRGDSMTPTFWDGAMIVFLPVSADDRKQFTRGKPYFFYDGDSHCTFKNVYWEPRRRRWRLESENKKYKPLFVPHREGITLARPLRMVVDF
jgi:SOS-response transcriptional repressor LexA